MSILNYLAARKFSESWKIFVTDGIQIAILGALTVFAVLSILWGALEIFKYVFYTLPKRNQEAEEEQDNAPVSQTQPQTVYTDDEEVVAAIMAAITAYRADEGIAPTVPFRVVSFRKKK